MKWAAIIVFLVLGAMIGLYAWSGGFHSVEVTEKQYGPVTILAAEHTGPYNKIGTVLDKVNRALSNTKIKPGPMAGIYYDDPGSVPEDKLRSAAGYLIEEQALADFDPEKHGLNVLNLPERKYIHTSFPNTNPFSMVIGISKVYPAIRKHIKDNGYQTYSYSVEDYKKAFGMEIYYDDRIEYYMVSPNLDDK